MELRLGVLAQRLCNERAELASLGPAFAVRQPDPIIGNDDAAAIPVYDAVQGDRPTVAPAKCMLERIGHWSAVR